MNMNKKSKKFITLILMTVLLASLSAPAFAEGNAAEDVSGGAVSEVEPAGIIVEVTQDGPSELSDESDATSETGEPADVINDDEDSLETDKEVSEDYADDDQKETEEIGESEEDRETEPKTAEPDVKEQMETESENEEEDKEAGEDAAAGESDEEILLGGAAGLGEGKELGASGNGNPAEIVTADQIVISNLVCDRVATNSKYSYISFDFTNNADGKDYTVFVTGLRLDPNITAQYISNTALGIAYYFCNSQPTAIGNAVDGNINPVDTEKAMTSVGTSEFGKDSLLCWAASTSNMLEFTGWAEKAGLSDEDRTFEQFVNHFTDKCSLTERGLKYFFNGINDAQTVVEGAVKFNDGTNNTSQQISNAAFAGYLPDYAAENYVTSNYIDANNSKENFSKTLEQLADGTAVGIGYSLINPDTGKSLGGHAVDVYGYIKEKVTGLVDSLKAVFLADSESANSIYQEVSGVSDPVPRIYRINQLEMYTVSEYTSKEGVSSYKINNGSRLNDVIFYYATLTPAANATEDQKETAGTKNAYMNVDYVPGQTCAVSPSTGKTLSDSEIRTGDTIRFRTNIMNRSYTNLLTECGLSTDSAIITYTYTVTYPNGETREIKEWCNLKAYGTAPLSSVVVSTFAGNTPETTTDLTITQTGTYTVTFKVDKIYAADGITEVPEAYYSNNLSPMTYSFTVGGTGGSTPAHSTGYQHGTTSVFGNTYKVEGSDDLLIDFEAQDEYNYVSIEGEEVDIGLDDYDVEENEDGTYTVYFYDDFIDSLDPGEYNFIVSFYVTENGDVMEVVYLTLEIGYADEEYVVKDNNETKKGDVEVIESHVAVPVFCADYISGSGKPLEIVFSSVSGAFRFLELNGKTIDEKDYKITSNPDGTYTLKLSEELLSELAPNVYDFILYTNSAIIIFRITVV